MPLCRGALCTAISPRTMLRSAAPLCAAWDHCPSAPGICDNTAQNTAKFARSLHSSKAPGSATTPHCIALWCWPGCIVVTPMIVEDMPFLSIALGGLCESYGRPKQMVLVFPSCAGTKPPASLPSPAPQHVLRAFRHELGCRGIAPPRRQLSPVTHNHHNTTDKAAPGM